VKYKITYFTGVVLSIKVVILYFTCVVLSIKVQWFQSFFYNRRYFLNFRRYLN
jgi:hypothetical protein